MINVSRIGFVGAGKVVMLRDRGRLSWQKIRTKVKNLKGKPPTWKTCARTYSKFNREGGVGGEGGWRVGEWSSTR